jgi:putative oxidoreductase
MERPKMHSATLPPQNAAVRLYAGFAGLVDKLQPIFALALRLCTSPRSSSRRGSSSSRAGIRRSRCSRTEFHVPCTPDHLAAYLGTGAELALPVLLALRIGTRFTAVALFVFNIVAVISYPDLSDAGLKDHILWGALLLVTLVYGPGRIAVDRFIQHQSGIDATTADACSRFRPGALG